MVLSLYKSGGARIIIRDARREDEQELAALAYQCYYNRFFNEEVTGKKGGSLREYPELIPDDEKDLGQNLKSFQDYWKEAMKDLDSSFICLVAEQYGGNNRKKIGFVKGYAEPAEVSFLKGNIGELGSLYINPDCQQTHVGSMLTRLYSKEMQKRGYDAMITRCYSKNNSQNFFAKMGAKLVGNCKIPNSYRQGSSEPGVCYISGDIMFWDKASLAKLSGTDVLQIDKGKDIWGNNVSKLSNRRGEYGRGY